MSLEILQLVDALAREKNVDKEIVLGALEHALALATKKRYPGDVDIRTLYVSPGFLERREGLFREYDRCAKRFGPQKAQEVCRMIVQHYRTVSMMDTGVVPPEPFLPVAEELADLLGLDCGRCTGTTRVFDKIFSGQWDEEFVCIPPEGTSGEDSFQPKNRRT